MHSLYAHLFIHLYFYTNIFIFLWSVLYLWSFRMANLKLMTEEEREAYFNRPESLKVRKLFSPIWTHGSQLHSQIIKIRFQERIANFRSDSYFSYAESFVGKVPGKYSKNTRLPEKCPKNAFQGGLEMLVKHRSITCQWLQLIWFGEFVMLRDLPCWSKQNNLLPANQYK